MPEAKALIVIDMLQSYDHEDAERLRDNVAEVLPAMCRLIERARSSGVPVLYVNDSLGDWRSDREAFLEQLLAGEHARLVEPIAPHEDAMLVVKARHSIFYDTPLNYILEHEELTPVAVIGQVTEQCVLYSVLDAHIRHLPVIVARDAVAPIDRELADAALKMMEVNMDADVCDADEVSFARR